jgi:hypothetical protein
MPHSQEPTIHFHPKSSESNKTITHLFINTKYPCLDICVMVVRDVVNCEHWAIFFGVSTLWPEGRKILLQEKKI